MQSQPLAADHRGCGPDPSTCELSGLRRVARPLLCQPVLGKWRYSSREDAFFTRDDAQEEHSTQCWGLEGNSRLARQGGRCPKKGLCWSKTKWRGGMKKRSLEAGEGRTRREERAEEVGAQCQRHLTYYFVKT